MSIEISAIHLLWAIGTIVVFALGYGLGKRAKLRELHELQRDGLLKITYTKHDAMKHMLYNDEHEHEHEHHVDDEGLDLVAYPRRERDEDRKVDWAKTLRRPGQ